MKKIFLLLLIPLLMLFSTKVHAQCAAANSVTTTITSTPNTCAGNGTIAATFSAVTSTTIQLRKGGTILQSVVNPTSPHTFTNLQPGTDYEVRTICSIDNSIVYSTNANITVVDNYVPLTNANISISNVCTSFTPGGTFTVNGVTGGNAPYQYSVILNNSSAYDDTLSEYSATPSAPPYTKTVTAFGTYQIRIKDACGAFTTFTRTISPDLPAFNFYWKSKKVCGGNQVQGTFWFADASGTAIVASDFLPEGVKLVIRDTNASGAILFDGTYTGTPFTYTESASHIYHVTTTNSCGLTSTSINDLSDGANNGEVNVINAVASSSGCGASETMTISSNSTEKYYWKYPITVTVTNSLGTNVYTDTTFDEYGAGSTWITGNLPMGNYTVTYVDACGETLSQVVTNPQSGGAPVLSIESYTKFRCSTGALTQNGTTQVTVQISGYLPDRTNTVVTITAGPSNVGQVASIVNGQYWGWTNMLPGTYTISYVSCGVTRTQNITVISGSNLLAQSLSSLAKSYCGSTGDITSTKVYNGAYANTVELLNSAGTVIASNTTGNFTGIAAGTYTTRLLVSACSTPYTVPGSSVTITNSTTGPTISSSVGVICEDAAGNPLMTGSAYLDLNGVAPLTLNYKPAGSSTWTTITNASANTVINGLTANITYDLQLIDACGSSISSVQIKTMGNLAASNTAQPCNGSPYALTMPYYAVASYEWSNPAGAVVSNTRVYAIANYDNSYNGTYVCKITWTNCVTRFVNVTLNSALCGGSIGVCGTVDSDGDGVFDLCDLDNDNDGILDTVEKCGGSAFIGWTDAGLDAGSGGNTTTTLAGQSVTVTSVVTSSPTGTTKFLGRSFTYSPMVNEDAGATIGGNVQLQLEQTGNTNATTTITFNIVPNKYGDLNVFFSDFEHTNFKIYALDASNNLLPVSAWNVKSYEISGTSPASDPNPYTVSATTISFTDIANTNFDGQNDDTMRVRIDIGTLRTATKIVIETARSNVAINPNDNAEIMLSTSCVLKDTDGDTIPDYLDLDSDGDGCPDAIEGGAAFTSSDLVISSMPGGNSGASYNGLSSASVTQNLGNTTVGNTPTTIGVPTIAGTGQTVGQSQNGLKNDCHDADSDGIGDWEDLDDDNDGILDTTECPTTVNDFIAAYGAGATTDIFPSDFGLALNARNQNVTRDLSAKFGYPANSGAVIVSITNASVHPTSNVWWTINEQQPSIWKVSGTMSAFLAMGNDLLYYANDSKTIHIYDNADVIPVTVPGLANQTPVAGQWSVTDTQSEKTLNNLNTNSGTVENGNWRYINMNFGPKSFGFSTTVASGEPNYGVTMLLECDTDGDGIPNRLDLDSDNDGCVDAIEGDENVTTVQLATAGGVVIVGTGSTASNQNLGNSVDTDGVPTVVNSGGAADVGSDQGQAVGDSQNAAVSSQCSSACYKPAALDAGNTYPTKHGITALGRAGAESDNWPMVRQSAWIALEAKTKGFVVNRVAFSDADSNPATPQLPMGIPVANFVEGMMVYDTTNNCLKVYTSTDGGTTFTWHCMSTQTCPQ